MITWLRSRYVWVIGLGLCCALVGHGLVVHRSLLNPDAIALQLEMLHTLSAIGIFILLQIGATAIGIPGTVLVIAGGAVFGLWLGTVLSVVGATLGAIAAFLLARHCLRHHFHRRFHQHPVLRSMNQRLGTNPLACVLTIRFAPISPFNLVNFWFGITAIPLPAYTLGTGLGIIPGTLAYTWLGVSGRAALQDGHWLPLVSALMLLTLLSAIPLLWPRWRDRRSP